MVEGRWYLNNELKTIQKSLDQYLTAKRILFPRFYFISDDDMLDILGKSKEPVGLEVLQLLKYYGENMN